MSDEWRADAACLNHDPELWFPASRAGAITNRAAARTAIGICRGCPARAACLDDALRVESQPYVGTYGIRGGLTEQERQPLIRAYKAPRGGAA